MATPPWREAASLVITSKVSLHELVAQGKNLGNLVGATKWTYSKDALSRCDYKVLLVKRSGLSSFMANAYVFPGGLVEPADFSPDWWTVFEKVNITRKDITNFCNSITGPRPPMIKNSLTLEKANASQKLDYVPPDIGFRIAAIRETFEETGILLLTQPSLESTVEATSFTLKSRNIDLIEWRNKIHKNPHLFVDMCIEANLCPDIWSLYEWSDWLTPTSVGHRRYDTMFYLCCLPKQPDVILDHTEVTTLRWSTPEAMLEDNSTGAVFLAPPQVYELSRIIHQQSFHHLNQFSKQRSTKGCERWLPIIATANDGAVSLLPGDELYPDEPDYIGAIKGLDFPYILDELRTRCQDLHRMEIRGASCTMYCNITPPCGHLQPLQYRSSQPIVQSYL